MTGRVNTETLNVDGAVQQREWEPSVAYYANGDVASPSTGFKYAPRSDQPDYTYAYADLGTFFANLVTMPYTLYKERNGVVSTGEQLPQTYTANPPLPPRGSGAVGGPMRGGASINATGGPAGQGTSGNGNGTGNTGGNGTNGTGSGNTGSGTGGTGNGTGGTGTGNTGGTGTGGGAGGR
jgi:hypothetical protein